MATATPGTGSVRNECSSPTMVDAAETLVSVQAQVTNSNRPQLQQHNNSNCSNNTQTNITFDSTKIIHGTDVDQRNTVITFKLKENEVVQCRDSTISTPTKVLPFHVLSYADLKPSCCKFERKGCLLKSWKISDPKARKLFMNPDGMMYDDITMFKVPVRKIKNGINVADVKLLKCANPKCAKYDNEGNKVDTVFHYCCYSNMKSDHKIDDILYDTEKNNFFSDEEKEVMSKMDNLTLKETIIPFCGKQCYNAINKLRNEKHKDNDASDRKKAAEHVINQNSMIRWDSDSRNGSFTSEEVIVNWITDAENAEKYFGGTHGKKAKVNGQTKESYHVHLSKLIAETNGTYDLICVEYLKCQSS